MSVQHWLSNPLHVIDCQSISISIRIVIWSRLLILAELVTIFDQLAKQYNAVCDQFVIGFHSDHFESNHQCLDYNPIHFTLYTLHLTLCCCSLTFALDLSLVPVHLVLYQLAGQSFHLCVPSSFCCRGRSLFCLRRYSRHCFCVDFCWSLFVL